MPVGPAHLHGPQTVGAPHGTRVAQPDAPPDSTPIEEEVETSDAARLLERLRQLPDIRQDRVDAIRAKIAEGSYETKEKLDVAVERLLDEIG